jgi:peptidoglycan/LPS O-acetylase OafA/YrhL
LDATRGSHAYRPEVDGLRALAVAAVVIFHAFPWMAPGGFVGVDVFFVISGYLISGIILRAVEQRTFSLTDFYVRRLRRILPALLVVLVACLAAGYLFWLADEWEALGRMTFAGALFHANIAAAGEPGGYFSALGGRTPLLHLWSLGVEEQFYLAWPILFAGPRPRWWPFWPGRLS